VPYKYAICIGVPMNRAIMVEAPAPRAGTEVMRTYRRGAVAAVKLAGRIRAMGWPAKAFGETKTTDLLHIPVALRAGLGQLGKHGSMISREYGSNFRLVAVATDLPLAVDAPVDIGVDDLCLGCRRCTLDCPADAISDKKLLVRGIEKWYVDFDKCAPYFAETAGCAICIEACPWSEPGRGFKLSDMLLAKRGAKRRSEQRTPAPAE
jgi:epoxyqueuosine reductase QueG